MINLEYLNTLLEVDNRDEAPLQEDEKVFLSQSYLFLAMKKIRF